MIDVIGPSSVAPLSVAETARAGNGAVRPMTRAIKAEGISKEYTIGAQRRQLGS
jgi:hypothetical protein